MFITLKILFKTQFNKIYKGKRKGWYLPIMAELVTVKKSKLIRRLGIPKLIDYFLKLSNRIYDFVSTDFSSSRKKYDFLIILLRLYFGGLFLRIMSVKKAIDVAMSKTKLLFSWVANFTISGVDNARLFVIAGSNTCAGNKSCYKTVKSYQSEDIPTFFQLFLEQAGLKAVKRWN